MLDTNFIDAAFESEGIDPDFTPVDNVPERALFAVWRQTIIEQGGDPNE